MDDKTLEIFTFEGAEPGTRLAVFGAVHGNEKSGTQAIRRIMDAIDSGRIKIKKGRLTLIPICNPRAYEHNVRFMERNLNRFMYPKDNPQAYEDYLDNQICSVLDETDYLLDLHTYTAPGSAFSFLSKLDQRNIDFVKAIGVPRYIYGWAEALGASDDLADKRQAIGTTEYIRDRGGVGVTLESGQHDYDRAPDFAFQAILNVLRFLGVAEIDERLDVTDLPDDGEYNIRMKGAYLKTREGDFVQDRQNMEFVEAGTVIARYDDGEEIAMPQDGYIVLPKRDTPIGHEWFFWGVEDEF